MSSAPPLSIAFVGHRGLPARYGGVEVHTEEIAVRLAARGHRVVSFASSPGGETTDEYRGIELRSVRRIDGKHIGAFSQALSATVALSRESFDVVHFMGMGPTVFVPVVRSLTRSTVVATIHGRDDLRRKWGPVAGRLMRLSFHACVRFPDRVIAVSRALARELEPRVGSRLVYISNGVTVPAGPDPEVSLREMGVDSTPFVLYAGRLVPEKRVEDLIEAFMALDTHASLVVAGEEASSYDYMMDLRRRTADEPRVRFIDHRSPAEVDLLMRHAAAFVLPSELEGLPIALLEATGRGVPVVVSDLPCHREVVTASGPGCRVVPVGDVPALAGAVLEALDHPEAARRGARVLADRVRREFDWDRVVDQLEATYRQALDTTDGRDDRIHTKAARGA